MSDVKYTKEMLNSLPKEFIITLLLNIQEQLAQMNQNYANLLEQIRIMNQRTYGRKTESSSSVECLQLDLALNETEVIQDENKMDLEPALEEAAPKKAKQKGKKENDLKKVTNHREEYIEISEEELDKKFGKGKWKRLPYAIVQKLEHIPASFEAVTYKIGVYAGNDNQTIIRADKPTELIEKSIATPSLVASLIMLKYVNAVPLYRQEQGLKGHDIFIPRNTMASWIIKVADRYLSYYYDAIKDELLKQPIIHADETPFLVSKDGRAAGSKSFMWIYRNNPQVSDHNIVMYNYCHTRGHENVERFLSAYHGILETDAYAAYHILENKHPDQYKVAGCWVHAERKYKEIIKANGKKISSPISAAATAKIQMIYHQEHKIDRLEPSLEQRKEMRQRIIKPLVDEFFVWAKETALTTDMSSSTGKALKYVINQEKYLRVFLDNPIVPLDNNEAERGIRSFTIGRKNWVLVDTPSGAEASAIVYSIVETAKANNLKIYEYFTYLLEELPKCINGFNTEIPERLLPWSEQLPEYLRKPVVQD